MFKAICYMSPYAIGNVLIKRDYFKTYALRYVHMAIGLHTNSFVHTENVFSECTGSHCGNRSDQYTTMSLGTSALSLFNTEQHMCTLAAFSANNAVAVPD